MSANAVNDSQRRSDRVRAIPDRTPPNLTHFLLTDPRARDAYLDWSAVLDEQVAFLHAYRRGDPAVDALAEVLAAAGGEEFTNRWRRRLLSPGRTGIHDLTHPDVGPLRLRLEGLELADRDYQRMIVHLPADAASSAGLDRLVGRQPGGLRSITPTAITCENAH